MFLSRLVFRKPYNRSSGEGNAPPFGAYGTTFPPEGALFYEPIIYIYVPLDAIFYQCKMVSPW